MLMTSAEANKLLRQFQEEKRLLLNQESQVLTFVAATTEKLEDARPPYDYESFQSRLAELDRKTRVIKHAISIFNTTQTVPGFDMTVDQLLVYLPQLVSRKGKLEEMAMHTAKSRLSTSSRSNIIEYEYANYDVERAQADLKAVTEEITRAQLALEQLNSSLRFEIEI